MPFNINTALLAQCGATLLPRKNIYWLVGGAGSGKTTISQALSAQFSLPIYNMDDHIYGTYHSRFTPERHPVNHAWSQAENGLAWLLAMSWDEFNQFNQAALPEYLHLLCEDLDAISPATRLLLDGGICNPALLAQAFPASQIICLAQTSQSSADIWSANEERQAMQEIIFQCPHPQEAWRKFLAFDEKITHTIWQECQESNITIFARGAGETVAELTAKVAEAWALS